MTKTAKRYKHAVIASDVVIFTIDNDQLKVLLIKMRKAPFADCWAMPGGLVRAEESVDGAAARLLSAKTGVKDVFLEQLYTFGAINRDPFGRVVSVAYFALIPAGGLKLRTTKEYAGVKWFPIAEVPKLAYDHKTVLTMAAERLRSKLSYTNIVCNLLPEEFTLGQLQKVYEVISGKKIDKRNFRKKLDHLKIVKALGRKTSGEACRPASLYAFIDKKPKIIDIL
jgi:8-oxo-dGTP diphosphatase